MRPARLSPDWRRRSMEADPTRRNCPAGSPPRIRSSISPRRALKSPGVRWDLIQHDKPPTVSAKVAPRVRQLLPIVRILQVEIEARSGGRRPRLPGSGRYGPCQRRLADLAWPQQRDRREHPKPIVDASPQCPRDHLPDHPCNYGERPQNCKVDYPSCSPPAAAAIARRRTTRLEVSQRRPPRAVTSL